MSASLPLGEDIRRARLTARFYAETALNIAAMRRAADVLKTCGQPFEAKALCDRAEASEAVLKAVRGEG